MLPNLEQVGATFGYDPITGALTWKICTSNRAPIGSPAGSRNASGHIMVTFFGHRIFAHRIGWFLTYGAWPGEIDHKNRNPSDNRIENLREVTHQQNIINRKLQSNNKTGLRGISWDQNRKKWRAAIGINGRTTTIGRYKTKSEAQTAYFQKAKEIHGIFNPVICNQGELT